MCSKYKKESLYYMVTMLIKLKINPGVLSKYKRNPQESYRKSGTLVESVAKPEDILQHPQIS